MTALRVIDGDGERPIETPAARRLRRSILRLHTHRADLHRHDGDLTPQQATLVTGVDSQIEAAIDMLQTLLQEEHGS